jgi:CRP/FNR family transcriptional regulator, cyclic AMP receptor protein
VADEASNSPAATASWPHAPEALRVALLDRGRTVNAARGQMVLTTGSSSDSVYIVQAGKVRVNLFPVSGREVLIRDIGAGELFGELAAIDGGRRSASIVAVDDSALIVIPGSVFRNAVTASPEAALWFARHLTRQLRYMNQRMLELRALNVSGRLHCQLLRLCAEAGVHDNRTIIEPAPTHDTLAAAIGSNRESVTRELGYLASIGLVEQDRRQLRILNVRQLASIVRDLTGDDNPADGLDDD